MPDPSPFAPAKVRGDRSLDLQEAAWWERFADVEEEYCWVQTPAVQNFLRGRYLRQIVRSTPRGARVLEIGCGAGWLCLLLARYGARQVVGLDPSNAQIERARKAAERAGLTDRAQFEVGTLSTSSGSELPAGVFDVLVLHAVLHHLSNEEIHDLLHVFRTALAAPGARVFIIEPIQQRREGMSATPWDRFVDHLILLPRKGRKLGLRRVGPAEAMLSAKIDGRGDSPKEAPFHPGELEQILAPHLHVEQVQAVLQFSYLGAKNFLLLQLSHPVVGRLLLWPYLLLLRSMERLVLRLKPGSIWLPCFSMFQCCLHDPEKHLVPRA